MKFGMFRNPLFHAKFHLGICILSRGEGKRREEVEKGKGNEGKWKDRGIFTARAMLARSYES